MQREENNYTKIPKRKQSHEKPEINAPSVNSHGCTLRPWLSSLSSSHDFAWIHFFSLLHLSPPYGTIFCSFHLPLFFCSFLSNCGLFLRLANIREEILEQTVVGKIRICISISSWGWKQKAKPSSLDILCVWPSLSSSIEPLSQTFAFFPRGCSADQK